MGLKLTVLDQSVAMAGRGQDESIRQTLALAIAAEKLGYSRFWVSEHHAHPSIVGTAPEILMAAIATQTRTIRIGSAGVMLPHYAALKVAEQFRVLDALAPGRIDLGVGRAPGSDGKTAQLLNPDRYASENFPQQVMELQAWVKGHPLPVGHPGHGVFAYPQSATSPDIWMLGSSDYGAQLAAHLGLPCGKGDGVRLADANVEEPGGKFLADRLQFVALAHRGGEHGHPLVSPHAVADGSAGGVGIGAS
jgi:luciferase family oxidoreductase group 1